MMFGNSPVTMGQPQPLGAMPQGQFPTAPDVQPPKRGMFGAGNFGIGQAIVAALNGYLAGTAGPGQNVGLSNIRLMQEMAQAKREQQIAEQRRQQQLEDEKSLYDYKAAHAGPDDFTQRVQALEALQPGLGTKYAQNYAANGGGSMIQFTDPATGQHYMMQQPGATGGASGAPQPGQVEQGYRFKGGNPADPSAWEPANGGQAATPPATFP